MTHPGRRKRLLLLLGGALVALGAAGRLLSSAPIDWPSVAMPLGLLGIVAAQLLPDTKRTLRAAVVVASLCVIVPSFILYVLHASH